MKNKQPFRVAFLMMAILAIAALACNLPANNVLNPNGEASEAPASQPDAIQPVPSEGSVTISLTEGQLNQLVQQALVANPGQPIENLQIRLEAGEAILSGTVNQQGLSLPLRLKIQASPDGQGGLTYQVGSATVGPLPLPESMRSDIETALNQSLPAAVNSLTNNIYIENIVINSGIMQVTGRPR